MTPPEHALTATLLTPPGVGAMAVIRLTGVGAIEAIDSCFNPHRPIELADVPGDRLVYGVFVDPRRDRETIDDGMVAITRHDDGAGTADMTVHGGLRVVERMLKLLQGLGASVRSDGDRPLAACALAKTRRALRFIAGQRDVLPAELRKIARLCETDARAGRSRLRRLTDRSRPAVLLVEGGTVVFTGPPNAGKSTLINRLFDRAESLVSDRAGTTRDWVTADVALDGVPLRVIDTAGVRDTGDPIERAAIDRGLDIFRAADIQVVVVDASSPVSDAFLSRIRGLVVSDRAILAINKIDLPSAGDPSRAAALDAPHVATSGLTGDGLGALRALLAGNFTIEEANPPNSMIFRGDQLARFADLLSDPSSSRLADTVREEAKRVFEDDRPKSRV